MTLQFDRATALTLVLIVLAILVSVVAPQSMTLANYSDIALNASHIAIGGLGMLLIILIGQIDVSVGAILAISATIAGLCAKAGMPPMAVVFVSVAVGAALGTLNGLCVVLFNVHSIVVTLGMLSIYRGCLIYATGGEWIYDLPSSFSDIGKGEVLGVPNPVLAVIILFPIAALLLKDTAIGRGLFAVGSNERAAQLAGINVPFVKCVAFALSGALVGLAAILFASRFNVVQSNLGIGFEFSAITVVVVGGASIFGGSGSVLGVLLGALLVSFMTTALVFLKVSSFWEQAVLGVLVLIAVLLDQLPVLLGRFSGKLSQ